MINLLDLLIYILLGHIALAIFKRSIFCVASSRYFNVDPPLLITWLPYESVTCFYY